MEDEVVVGSRRAELVDPLLPREVPCCYSSEIPSMEPMFTSSPLTFQTRPPPPVP